MTAAAKGVILVVDDNASLAENLAEILEDAGYKVQCVGTCQQAKTRARGGYDVALVDVLLPDGDGTVLARSLKEDVPDSEVVLLTGHASVESAAAAVRAGASAYLIKPCPPDELLLTVERAMRQVRLQQERREFERRAQTAEKLAAVGTLTAGLSHEIRNPLNAPRVSSWRCSSAGSRSWPPTSAIRCCSRCPSCVRRFGGSTTSSRTSSDSRGRRSSSRGRSTSKHS